MLSRSRWRFACALAVLALASLPAPSLAAFPGGNGRVAYVEDGAAPGDLNIFTVNPDGSGVAQLTTDPDFDLDPQWSPDGQRILFTSDRGGLGSQIYVMNADGTSQTRLTDPPDQHSGGSWSSDGQRIVVSKAGDLWIMDADGTDPAQLTNLPGSEGGTAWSPDGQRIAFEYNQLIYSIRPDGTGLTQVTAPPEPTPFMWFINDAPDWSPDGTRIVYRVGFDNDGEFCHLIRTIRADGTGRFTVYVPFCDDLGGSYLGPAAYSPNGSRIVSWGGDSFPLSLFTIAPDGSGRTSVGSVALGAWLAESDWQPVPDNTTNPHVRPKGATPFRVPLVPAAKPCIAPNRTHGPPLAFSSCNPVQPESTYLTAGVGDGSPALSRSEGGVRMDVNAGAPGPPEDSDVLIRFSLTNVMRASNLSEYTGELRSQLTVRRTDRDPPGFGAPHSTTMDFPFGFTVPCAPTPESSLDASTCASLTSVNAVIPLAIEDTHRAIWAFDKLRVYDGGPDEDADTEGDNSLFMTQGIFVP